jgi:hypothetical protein
MGRLKNALKTKNIMKRNFNNIFKDKILNKLFCMNGPSVCQRKTRQNGVAKIINNTVWEFSIVINTWRWPGRAEACLERGREEKIKYMLCCIETKTVKLYVTWCNRMLKYKLKYPTLFVRLALGEQSKLFSKLFGKPDIPHVICIRKFWFWFS